jgi:hypothetical protein
MDTVNLIKDYKQEDHNKDPKVVNRARFRGPYSFCGTYTMMSCM